VSKRILDFIPAAVGLFLLSSLLLLVALLIKLDSPGLVFVGQEHMANGLRPFRIYKFRTMVRDTSRRAGPIPFGADPRLTQLATVNLTVSSVQPLVHVAYSAHTHTSDDQSI
jgi:lipopolysaccharide/colanic/teichoic acid biosynthesis glycosyltransferase